MAVAYLALGSNLGDRLGYLRQATQALQESITVAARSPVFETDSVAPDAQPPYLNAALRVETALAPRALLDLALAVEARLGRQRPAGQRWAPRTIDLDLLLHGSAVVDEPGLVVPHPRLLERAFVRVPLALVAESGLRHPLTGERLDVSAPSPEVRPFVGALFVSSSGRCQR
jgi:2-amino-4-hydroxy-6-hydroxymethyldihydropteridine diphosphokinase